MRRRSCPLHVPIILPVLLACATLVTQAAAQHCWPSSVALLVRDERGALIHPDELDGYTYTPEKPDSSDQGHDLEHRTDGRWGPRAPAGTYALRWWGQGDCRVHLDEVVLRRGGREMRLRLSLRGRERHGAGGGGAGHGAFVLPALLALLVLVGAASGAGAHERGDGEEQPATEQQGGSRKKP